MGSFKNSLQSSASVSTFNLAPSLFMVEPSSEPVITIDSDTTGVQSHILGENVREIGLFSISSIFLVLTIAFGIFLVKRQQKRQD